MYQFLASMACALLLVSVTEGAAAPKAKARAQPPQVAEVLTYQEQLCEALGNYVFVIAKARDEGYSVAAALRTTRQISQEKGLDSPWQDVLESTIPTIYRAKEVTPREIQRHFTLACFQKWTASTARTKESHVYEKNVQR